MKLPTFLWAKKINDVRDCRQYGIDLGLSPAAVGQSSGNLYINPPVFNLLSEDEKVFVICHECSHIKGRTTDEELTDAIAFEMYKKTGRSLKASVYSLAKVLNWFHPRVIKQLERAEAYDKKKFKRKK